MKILACIILSNLLFSNAYAIQKTTILLDAIVKDINTQAERRAANFIYVVESKSEDEIIKRIKSDRSYAYVNAKIGDEHILIYSIKNKMWKVVKELVEAGSNIDYQDSLGKVPVMYAAEMKEIRIVSLLKSKKVDLTVPDLKGVTAAEYLKKNGMM